MNRRCFWIIGLSLWFLSLMAHAASCMVEAEAFTYKGGWVVDQQFMDQMGSPYLLAHGMGSPVADAYTEVSFPELGDYYVYVRTYNWTAPWKAAAGPGQFSLLVDGKPMASPLGTEGTAWMWQAVGKVSISRLQTTITLHDLTGFDGRCDALYFTTEADDVPPADLVALDAFRRKALGMPAIVPAKGTYDLVVVGGGVAGISAAVSAARLGCRVALVNDRPVLGGNNSSEVRVHLGGRLESGPYKALGDLQKEFGPTREGNAQPASNYADEKKATLVANEPNITLYANCRATAVEKEGSRIRRVIIQHTERGEEMALEAPLFADCTGDGTIGYLAGADYRMGRESEEEFAEPTAPKQADAMTMGSSVQWYSEDAGKPTAFPEFSYGVVFNEQNSEKVMMGEWTWETGMHKDQIKEFEQIRDYGLLVVYSNWSYLKNRMKENEPYRNRKLAWVAYVAGKRESRRLLGDYILTENDLRNHTVYEDGTAAATWTIDLHYPDPDNTANFPGGEFKSIAKHIPIHPYPIPYRCLYSRNVSNLFMAGRDISVTHVALGTVRVMRTTGMMGEVVGMAASICTQQGVEPRAVYQHYLPQLKTLMEKGVGKSGLPNNQQYNEGTTLGEK